MVNADAKQADAALILENDPGRDELYVFLPGSQGSAQWVGTEDFRTLTSTDGKVIGVFIRRYNRWKGHHSSLVELIARTLKVSRDEVVEVLAPISRRAKG